MGHSDKRYNLLTHLLNHCEGRRHRHAAQYPKLLNQIQEQQSPCLMLFSLLPVLFCKDLPCVVVVCSISCLWSCYHVHVSPAPASSSHQLLFGSLTCVLFPFVQFVIKFLVSLLSLSVLPLFPSPPPCDSLCVLVASSFCFQECLRWFLPHTFYFVWFNMYQLSRTGLWLHHKTMTAGWIQCVHHVGRQLHVPSAPFMKHNVSGNIRQSPAESLNSCCLFPCEPQWMEDEPAATS